ncbi:ribonucleoside triphosphate reductase [Candidatus Woesearchaeota archaeon]|nr:ribonucleoside triphosphate reductase [Candidatus Woesearchaeota archaeon]
MTGELSITKIQKRDGRVVPFDHEKITNAIFKAAQAVGGTDRGLSEKLCDQVVNLLEERYDGHTIPNVEDIQDIVEYILVENGHYRTAKAYILYRQQHKNMRELKGTLVDVRNVINEYIDRVHFNVNENSNEQYSFSGLLLYTAGELIKNYALSEMYAGPIAEAHRSGHIHIHDLSHAVIGYCAGWSLKKLLEVGFGGVKNKVDAKPAKHMDVVVSQMVNYIGCLQMEWAGAQAFSSVDTFLAPFVRTDKLSYKQIRQNMQRLVFSLNIPSRWGSQYPFSNLTFDWVVPQDLKNEPAIVAGRKQKFTYGDCQKEMDLINKAFLEVMREGDAKGRIFTFPIPTYNLTRDFNWGSENADLLFEVTAKFGLPYFQNYIGSGLDPRSIRAMCCRLNLDLRELVRRPGHTFAMGDSTGSVGVITINMNRLGYEAKDKEEFFKKLAYYMDLAKQSLEVKRKVVQKNMDNGLMPFTRIYLGTLKNHFSTIGLCGMNECCLNFLGKDISTHEGKEFTIETLNFMRTLLTKFQEETGNIYNLEATPAESTAYRFGRLDKSKHPNIMTAGDKVPYLTNSTHLPVDKTDDIIEALEHQNDIQYLYTGGTMFHTFLGQRVTNAEACKRMVKKIAYNTRIPYFSITPTFSICDNHGYIAGEHFTCPTCESNCEVYSRIVGYFRPINQWNLGKREEFKQRLEYSEEKSFSRDLILVKDKDNIKGDGIDPETNKISHYEVLVLPGCNKCSAAKTLLSDARLKGRIINLGDDNDLKEFRKHYKEVKDKIKRNEDGSLSVPTILFYGSDNELIRVVTDIDQLKSALAG